MIRFIVCSLGLLVGGCSVTAPVDLAAAQALETLASEMDLAFSEYHEELREADSRREEAVMSAFVARVQADHEDPEATADHVRDFRSALTILRNDAEVEMVRLFACQSNVEQVRNVADGLREIALGSMSLDDEGRRLMGMLGAGSNSKKGR